MNNSFNYFDHQEVDLQEMHQLLEIAATEFATAPVSDVTGSCSFCHAQLYLFDESEIDDLDDPFGHNLHKENCHWVNLSKRFSKFLPPIPTKEQERFIGNGISHG